MMLKSHRGTNTHTSSKLGWRNNSAPYSLVLHSYHGVYRLENDIFHTQKLLKSLPMLVLIVPMERVSVQIKSIETKSRFQSNSLFDSRDFEPIGRSHREETRVFLIPPVSHFICSRKLNVSVRATAKTCASEKNEIRHEKQETHRHTKGVEIQFGMIEWEWER